MTDPVSAQRLANPNATTLIMGEGGSGKSSLLATLAIWVWLHFHKWSAYYLLDGGGVPTMVSALQRKGIIKLWRMRTRGATNETQDLTLETIARASQGYWPRRIHPVTGETAPDVELVAPTQSVIQTFCPCGTVEGEYIAQVQIPAQTTCPGCKKAVNASTRITKRVSRITPGFELRGACLFDGISSGGDWGLEALSHLHLKGEESRLGGKVQSGGMTFGENNRAQVGFMQTRSLQWLVNGGGIPNLVVPAVWTALTSEGTEDGLQIVGPKLPGQAKTAAAPQCVGNLLEAVAEDDANGNPVRRLYIKGFIDKQNRRHLLKPRAYPGLLPAFLEDPDTDDPAQVRFENFNLGKFFELMEQARIVNETMIDQQFADAPGVVEGIEEFGGPMGVPAPAAPAVAAGAAPVAAGPRAAAPRVGAPKVGPAARRAPVVTPAVAPVASPTPAPVTEPAPAPEPVPTPPAAEVDAIVETLSDAPITSTPGNAPAPSAMPVVPVQTSPTTPQAPTPPAPRPPMRAPVAAPPGRRPVPVAVRPKTGGQ